MTGQAASLLSRRATTSLANTSNALWDILTDLWHPQRNPSGYVSLGVADNVLMQEQLLRRMNNEFNIAASCLSLGDTIAGSVRLKTAIAHFLNRHLSPAKPLQPSHIITTNGVTSAIEHCSWGLCDPGDGILIGRPFYRAFKKDISLRPASIFVPVSFEGVDPLSTSAIARYEKAVELSREQGCTIRAIMIRNPHNPLGRCYPRSFLEELMRMCQKYGIHLVSDEIYALSVWRKGQDEGVTMDDFTSVLSINPDELINPRLVHALWGVSKDFGSNGLRLGAVISQNNPDLLESIRGVSQYSSISGLADYAMASILEDQEFVDQYVRDNRERLDEQYTHVTAYLDDHDIPYARGSNAGFFVWFDLLTPCLRIQTGRLSDGSESAQQAACNELTEKLRMCKLHLGDGDDFGSEQRGWFRLTFSQYREQLDEGLRRIVQALRS